jgi:SAM-dependent methyltransferase
MSRMGEPIPCGQVNTRPRPLKKTYIRVPPAGSTGPFQRLTRLFAGSILSPLYWIFARLRGGPGLRFRWRCAVLALHLIRKRTQYISASDLYRLLFSPIDSVRYFEFEFIWNSLSKLQLQSYLDVSSPRLFPIIFLRDYPHINAELVNPDRADLELTSKLVAACGLERRCQLHADLIEDVPLTPESFDAVTSISVIEHIPNDTNAISNVWRLLKPGGTLLLSVPCAAVAEEEYIDVDFYSVQTPDSGGFFFHQYKYDQAFLEERIYSVTGSPIRTAIFGEKIPGTLHGWLFKRWTGQKYPIWREPYSVCQAFRYYEKLSDLPGDGVIAMEFVKR